MANKLAPGVEAAFQFVGWDGQKRSGKGVIAHAEIVGTSDAWTIKVTESPNYRAGEFVDVRCYNCWAV
jgi:hypothetical protein